MLQKLKLKKNIEFARSYEQVVHKHGMGAGKGAKCGDLGVR